MTEGNVIKEIFKLTLKDLGVHFKNISQLFSNPIRSWRKIISQRKTSFDFYILIVVYYALFLFFLISNWKNVIPVVLADLLLTFIPFSILYLPFKVFTKIWRKRIKSNRLFRLLFVLKIQLNIFLLMVVLLAKWLELDSLYIIFDNFIWLIILCLISIFPLLVKIQLWKKVVWVFANYVSSLVYLFVFGVAIMFIPELQSVQVKSTKLSPTFEQYFFQAEYNYSDLSVSTEYFIAILDIEDDRISIRNSQFAKSTLILELIQTYRDNISNRLEMHKAIQNGDLSFEGIGDPNKSISLAYMDSIRLEFNQKFYEDLHLVDSLKMGAKFTSNRNYYSVVNEFLFHYDSLHKSPEFLQGIANQEPDFILQSDQNKAIAVHNLHDPLLNSKIERIINQRKKLSERESKSVFLQNLYVWPVEKIIELVD